MSTPTPGRGESTTDLVFSGHNLIAENGALLAESRRFTTGVTAVTEIDLSRLSFDRRRMNVFRDGPALPRVEFELPVRELRLTRKLEPCPSSPRGRERRSNAARRC